MHLLNLAPLRVVGGVGSLRLPPWGGEHGACLMDYVPLIHKLLTDKVDSIVQSYVRRKEYTAALLSMMGRSVLEYDTEGFKKVAFLFEQQGFSFVAHCKLTAQAIAPIGSISLHKVSPSLPPSLSPSPPPPPPPRLPLSLPPPSLPSLPLHSLSFSSGAD